MWPQWTTTSVERQGFCCKFQLRVNCRVYLNRRLDTRNIQLRLTVSLAFLAIYGLVFAVARKEFWGVFIDLWRILKHFEAFTTGTVLIHFIWTPPKCAQGFATQVHVGLPESHRLKLLDTVDHRRNCAWSQSRVTSMNSEQLEFIETYLLY